MKVFSILASLVFLGQRDKHHVLGLSWVFFFLTVGITSAGLDLPFGITDDDLLGRSCRLLMVETPIRVPSVVLLSWKNEPVDWVSKSDEKSVEEEQGAEAVSKVWKEVDPKR